LEGHPLPEEVEIMINRAFNIPYKILTNSSRNKVIAGLKPVTRYYIYYVAYNNHGCSSLSN